MKSIRPGLVATCVVVVALCVSVYAQDLAGRQELTRVDLSGVPGTEVITSISEIKSGEEFGRHIHHGLEVGYVMQGGMIQFPGKEPVMVPTGAPITNLRDVPHAGFKVVGEQSIKFYTVHVVDKGKPLYDWVK